MKSSLLREALRISLVTLPKNRQRYKHWSFIIQGNSMVEYGTNIDSVPPVHFGYHNRIEDGLPKLHSEIRAWRKAKGLLAPIGFEVINIRLNTNGEWRNSRPCSACQELLQALGCFKVWYTTNNGWKSLSLHDL